MKITTSLVGASFRPSEARDALRRTTIGDRLSLEPDPENEYDSEAVRVMVEGHHAGFIAKKDNSPISKRLLSGDEVFAEIIAFENPIRPVLEIEL